MEDGVDYTKITVGMNAQLVEKLGNNNNGLAAAMLYNLITYFSEDDIHDGWVRISGASFKRRTTFSNKVFLKAKDLLLKEGLIEFRSGALDEENMEYGKGMLFRPIKPRFGAVGMTKDLAKPDKP